MGDAGEICAYIGFFCALFIPFIFQTIGFFTPMWASSSTCDSIGLLYSCCNATCGNTNGVDELNSRVLGLQASSFGVMFLTVVFSFCGMVCFNSDESPCLLLGLFCASVYPAAGLFSIIGCIIIATKFSTSELGYSFYLCVTAGCLILVPLLIILGCYALYKYIKDKINYYYPKQSTNTVSPSDCSDSTSQDLSTMEETRVMPYSGAEGLAPKRQVGNDGQHGTEYPPDGYGRKSGQQSIGRTSSDSNGRPTDKDNASDSNRSTPSQSPYPGGTSGLIPYSGAGVVAPRSQIGYDVQHGTVYPSDGNRSTPSQSSYPGGTASVMPYSGAGVVAPRSQIRHDVQHGTEHPSDGNGSTPSQSSYPGADSSVIPYSGAGVVAPRSQIGYNVQHGTVHPSDGNGSTPSQSSFPGGTSSVMPYSGTGEVRPHEQSQTQIDYEAQHATVEEAVAVHDAETGKFFVFLKKISLSKIVASLKHKQTHST